MKTLHKGLHLISVLYLIGAAAAACDVGWREYNGKCFTVSDDQLIWIDAAIRREYVGFSNNHCEKMYINEESVCGFYGGGLALINSIAEDNWLTNYVASRGAVTVWIGGTCRFHKYDWEWVPSLRKFNSSFTKWQGVEPNNIDTEQCLILSGGYWVNEVCTKPYRYVCQRQSGIPGQCV